MARKISCTKAYPSTEHRNLRTYEIAREIAHSRLNINSSDIELFVCPAKADETLEKLLFLKKKYPDEVKMFETFHHIRKDTMPFKLWDELIDFIIQCFVKYFDEDITISQIFHEEENALEIHAYFYDEYFICISDLMNVIPEDVLAQIFLIIRDLRIFSEPDEILEQWRDCYQMMLYEEPEEISHTENLRTIDNELTDYKEYKAKILKKTKKDTSVFSAYPEAELLAKEIYFLISQINFESIYQRTRDVSDSEDCLEPSVCYTVFYNTQSEDLYQEIYEQNCQQGVSPFCDFFEPENDSSIYMLYKAINNLKKLISICHTFNLNQ